MKSNHGLPAHHHDRLAIGYAVATGLALVVGGLLALGLGLQPLAGGAAVDEATHRQLYSMHGMLSVFLVALPAIPAVLGNRLLPRLLGIDEMALPRLNRLGFHLHIAGSAAAVAAAVFAPGDAGWSLELPRSLTTAAPIGWGLLATAFLAAATVCASINLVATVAASRDDERPWSELPLFGWALAIAAAVQALAAPLFFVAITLLFAERAGGTDYFSAAPAGDLRFDELFWLWAQPALAGAVVAALGLVGMVLREHTGRDARADRAEVASLLALAVLGFASAGTHVIGRSLAAPDAAASSALALAAALPLAVLLGGWTRDLIAGTEAATPALAWAGSGLVMICIGAASGMLLVIPATATQLHATAFATAQFHYLVAGGTLCALFAGLYHAWPRWFGVEPRALWGHLACAMSFVGFQLAFAPLFTLGLLGQPRRTVELLAGGEGLGIVAAVGTLLLVAGLGTACWNLLSALFMERVDAKEAA